MASLLFKIASELEAKGFKEAGQHVRNMEKGTKQAGDSAKDATGKVDLLKGAYGALIALGVVAFFKSAVDEQLKLERSTFLLGQRVENTGLAWDEVRPKVEAFNKALAEQTGIAIPEVNDALSRLIDSTNDVGKAQEFLSATMGLARAQGLSYSTAAEQVGRATLGVTEFTKTLAERIGITGEKAKDVEFVLKTLKERFGTLAQEEDTAAKKMEQFKNEIDAAKADIGAFFIPIILEVITALRRLGRSLDGVITILTAGLNAAIQGNISMLKAFKLAISGNFAAAGREIKNAVRIQAAMVEEMKEGWKALSDAMGGPLDATAALPEMLARGEIKAKELTAVFKKMRAEFRAVAAEDDAARLEQLFAALEHEKAIRGKAIADQMAAEGFNRDQINTMVLESDKALDAERLKVAQAFFTKKSAMAFQTASIVGTAAAKGLQGETDAWRQASIAIIDMIAQRAQAAIMSNAIIGASKEVATKGLAGLGTGAALIAWGAAQSAVVAALAQAAKGAIGGAGGVGTATAGAGAAGGAAPAAAPAPAAAMEREPTTDLRVVFVGDVYGETEVVDRLAEKLSAAVENRDVRLVSTQTQAGVA